MEKSCLQCGDKISGRSDKKFCSDYCRNAFNNDQNRDVNNYVRNINNILRKNRRILAELNVPGITGGAPLGPPAAPEGLLLREGFLIIGLGSCLRLDFICCFVIAADGRKCLTRPIFSGFFLPTESVPGFSFPFLS